MAFTPEQEAALRDILALWGQASVVLIGGAALGALAKMSWRTTRDLDLAVSELLKKSPSLGFRWAKPPCNPLGARTLRARASRP